jgi:N6-adenosine-specific RNA methylase IME4
MLNSSILYQNLTATIILIDIPRSIELAQAVNHRKLLSSRPLDIPFPSLEPRSEQARQNLPQIPLQELLVQKHVEFALQEVKKAWKTAWCLSRIWKDIHEAGDGIRVGSESPTAVKRKSDRTSPVHVPEKEQHNLRSDQEPPLLALWTTEDEEYIFHQNAMSGEEVATAGASHDRIYIPPKSTFIQGSILSTLPLIIHHAPQFDLVILDPPWPNRSARRKKSYGISYNGDGIQALLRAVPLDTKLAEAALVGVWITNKAAFRNMLLKDNGIFQRWGVRLIEEWLWIKVTRAGEPVTELDSAWRKPYEILLVARKGRIEEETDVKRKVVVGVPDLHSRKPNLKEPFEVMMGKEAGEYQGLEVFARNLTAGWWSWGDEVLKYQSVECWGVADGGNTG